MIPTDHIAGTLRALARSMGLIGVLAFTLVDGSLLWILPGLNDIVLISFVLTKNTFAWAVVGVLTATLGSLIGATTIYSLARRGGTGLLRRRIPPALLDKVKSWIHRWGPVPVGLAALAPPPCPYSPFVVTAGVVKLPRPRFQLAVALGRGMRYSLDAALALYLGRHLLTQLHEFYWDALEGVVFLMGLGLLIWWIYRLQFATRRGYFPELTGLLGEPEPQPELDQPAVEPGEPHRRAAHLD